MRKALLSVLLSALLLPAAIAQTQVLEDAPDDATARAGGAVDTGADTSSLDMSALFVTESTEAFTFTLQVGEADPESPTPTDSGILDVDVNHGDQGYRIRFIRDTTTGDNRFAAQFMAYEPGRGDYVYRERVDMVVDGQAETFSVELPRDWLLDGNGTAPTIGRELDLFRAFSRNTNAFGAEFGPSAVQIRDAMPDSGYGDIPYPIELGLRQSGHAFLASEIPARASNGEKGTFVFYVDASNLDADEDRFDLSVKQVPEEWEVTLPGATVRLDGNETRTFPVLATVPFAHQHGAYETFIVEMKSRSDPDSVGRLELGIRYLETPQPAGHHDQLHVHTRTLQQGGDLRFGGETHRAFFNTLEDDENDEDVGVAPNGGFVTGGRQRFQWELYLEPGLQMGLDFDLNRTGELADIQISSEYGQHSGALSGYLVHRAVTDGDVRETVVATIPPTSPQTISSGTSFEGIIQPTKASDRIPFMQQASLVLRLNLTLETQEAVGGEELDPKLMGGQFTLPLNEYRDDVQGVFNSLAGLDFRNLGEAERPVNPGETVLFNLTLTNEGAVDDVFELRVNGTNVGWARVLGDQEIFVGTGSSRPVVVAVSPPDDAPHLDIVDLIVTAASKAEPTVQGNIRVVAVVDDVLDHPDESHLVKDLEKQLASKKKSPAAPIAVIGLALLALARRR